MSTILPELIPFRMNEEILKEILLSYLKGWTEIEFTPNEGVDKKELAFYDGFIGTIIRTADVYLKFDKNIITDKFIQSCIYSGKIYRILHKCKIDDRRCKKGFRYGFPKVEYNNMITHWTKDKTFNALMHKLNPDEDYIILEADTKDRFAFDINKYRKYNGIIEQYTDEEEEVIFPMYKDYITEYKMSINKFKNLE